MSFKGKATSLRALAGVMPRPTRMRSTAGSGEAALTSLEANRATAAIVVPRQIKRDLKIKLRPSFHLRPNKPN
jgi:hypothetical protein